MSTQPELINRGLDELVQRETGTRPLEKLDLYTEHAKEKCNLPNRWRAYKWECFPKREDTIYVAITGAVCEHLKPNGETNWKKRDKATERTVNLVLVEHESWKRGWEQKNSMCSDCIGSGQVMASWSVKEGLKTRPCRKCSGTGKPHKDVNGINQP
jgi:hypothetical protein